MDLVWPSWDWWHHIYWVLEIANICECVVLCVSCANVCVLCCTIGVDDGVSSHTQYLFTALIKCRDVIGWGPITMIEIRSDRHHWHLEIDERCVWGFECNAMLFVRNKPGFLSHIGIVTVFMPLHLHVSMPCDVYGDTFTIWKRFSMFIQSYVVKLFPLLLMRTAQFVSPRPHSAPTLYLPFLNLPTSFQNNLFSANSSPISLFDTEKFQHAVQHLP